MSARRRLSHVAAALQPTGSDDEQWSPAGSSTPGVWSLDNPGRNHPSPAERFRFGNEGYLLLPDLLPPEFVARLVDGLERTAERRRAPGYKWPGHRPRLGGGGDQLQRPTDPSQNIHVGQVLHEELPDGSTPFLELMTYPPVLEYVHGLFNPDAKFSGRGGFIETTQASHGR